MSLSKPAILSRDVLLSAGATIITHGISPSLACSHVDALDTEMVESALLKDAAESVLILQSEEDRGRIPLAVMQDGCAELSFLARYRGPGAEEYTVDFYQALADPVSIVKGCS